MLVRMQGTALELPYTLRAKGPAIILSRMCLEYIIRLDRGRGSYNIRVVFIGLLHARGRFAKASQGHADRAKRADTPRAPLQSKSPLRF